MKRIDLGNNESAVTGIHGNHDGTFTALTLTAGATFKTMRAAAAWLQRRGYGPNGENTR